VVSSSFSIFSFCIFIAQWSQTWPDSGNFSLGVLDVFTKQSLHWLQWTYTCNNRHERISDIYLRQRHMVMLCAYEEMSWERNGVLLLLCAICSQQHSKASLPTKDCYFPFLARKMEIQTEILLLSTTHILYYTEQNHSNFSLDKNTFDSKTLLKCTLLGPRLPESETMGVECSNLSFN